jgi:putative permease
MSGTGVPSVRQSILTRFAVIAVLTAAVFVAFYALRHTFSTFMLAFVLAYLFDPFVVWLEKKRKVRRTYGIVILYTILGIISIFCVAYLIPFLNIRWQGLVRDLPLYVQKVKGIIGDLTARWEPLYATEELDWLASKGTEGLDKLMAKAGEGVYATATRVAFNVLNILLSPILVFFMLFYKESIIASLKVMIPRNRREAFLEVGREINRSMGGFIRGQIIVSVIVAVLSTAALILLDVDYPVLNGIFAGLASVLPFIGVILATLPPLFFAYVKFQNGSILLQVIGCFGFIYFLEGYVVKPLVFKESMDLNPLATILVVMALGELMGFWGIILAIPFAAAMKIFAAHIRAGDFADD